MGASTHSSYHGAEKGLIAVTVPVLPSDTVVAPTPAHEVPADGAARQPRPRSRGRWVAQFFTGAVLSYLWAAVCNASLNVLQTGGDVSRIFTYDLTDAPVIFLLSSAVLWMLMLLVYSVTGRIFLSGGLLMAACVILGFANYQKMQVRNEPLLPGDMTFARQAGFLMDMVSMRVVVTVVTIVVLVLIIAVLLGRIASRTYPRVRRAHGREIWRAWITGRIVIALVAVLFLAYLAQFNDGSNKVRALYERGGAQWAFWYQKVNYLRHGAVAGYLYNLPTVPMEKPEGYSEETMEQLAARYEQAASDMNQGTDATGVKDLNVVIVLGESFSDPTEIAGVELERDPIPFTRDLMQRSTAGTLLTQRFGGGTANMEFEALTGQSVSQFTPQHDTPYSMSVYKADAYPSVVGYLENLGHSSMSIHPYMPTMYKREEAYAALGIDDFFSEKHMHSTERIDNSEFISDEAALDEALLRMRGTPETDVVNVVTMQNHYPTDDVYDDPMEVSGVAEDAVNPLGNFARGLELSDLALRKFVNALERWDEPTAVVYYGDHQPALWESDPDIAADEEAMHRAPFIMWSNVADLPARRIPLVSPTQFMPVLFQSLGLEIPPYYALLARLEKRISAMENGRYYAPSGQEIENPEQDPELASLLHDYRLVQYDFSVGERYALDQMFPQG